MASEAQEQTASGFGYQWSQRETYESEAVQAKARKWLLERYCGGDENLVEEWLAGQDKTILDVGCGAGYSALALFGNLLKDHWYVGVDLSSAVGVAMERFRKRGIGGHFLRADLMDMPVPDGQADIILAEGVLHHTDDTALALGAVCKKLKPGGRILFYVYAKKGAVREFTDDMVRQRLSGMTDAEAWEALKPLTKLGILLGERKASLRVPDVPLLDIKAGTYDVQRLFYWFFCKAFYRDDYEFGEMHHNNFDWYRPLNCHRHTPAEVRKMCDDCGLTIERFDVEPAGISVVATKGTQ